MAIPVGVNETTIIIMKTRSLSQALLATIIMKTRVLSQALLATIIIIMNPRELLANTGNSSPKMAAPMGVVRLWHH